MAANKTRSNSTKGKGRDKDLEAFDNNKTDKTNARAEAVEAFLNGILSGRGMALHEKAFFTKMIDDVKNGDVDGFVMDDFYFLTKFSGSKKGANEALQTLRGYFCRLCEAVEIKISTQDDEDMRLCYENFKKARGLLNIALPLDGCFCQSLDEVEQRKAALIEAHRQGKRYVNECGREIDFDPEKEELNIIYSEFLKRAYNYFIDILPSKRFPSIEKQKQFAKDRFRDALHDMDIFYKAKIGDIIDNSTLTQSICNYVMKNFADFLAEYEKTENDFRKSDK